MIKKADILLFFLILAFGLVVSWWSLAGNAAGEKVTVTVDGRLYGTYPLSQDQTIQVVQENGHHNDITIKDGQVSMTFSDCRNQICVESGAISQTKDTIVCLPNKVVIEVTGGGGAGSGVDIITGTAASGSDLPAAKAEGGDAHDTTQ
ncbi:MAG: NusG domain II-containing protein [Anaerovoracaceae bacterium]